MKSHFSLILVIAFLLVLVVTIGPQATYCAWFGHGFFLPRVLVCP